MAISQNEKNMYALASEIISPHDGSGGCTPRPRKDSAASSRIALRHLQRGDDDQVRQHVGQHFAEQHARGRAPAACAAAT